MQNDVKALVCTCLVYLCSLIAVLAWDRIVNGTITGRGLAGSIVAAIVCTVWWEYRRRRIERERLKDDKLRRRGLFHQNGGDRGEVSGAGLAVLAALVGLALIFASVQFCIGAELDAALAESTEKFFPAVPLSGPEFRSLQALTLAAGVILKQVEQYPPNMDPPAREVRAKIKRDLDRVQAILIDATVSHASALVTAARKAGRP